MSNATTTIEKLLVEFLPDTTEVYIIMTSSEPDNPFWGNGCKHKSYPASESLKDILPDLVAYIDWEYVCPSCHREKKDTKFCANPFHKDVLDNILDMFNEEQQPL